MVSLFDGVKSCRASIAASKFPRYDRGGESHPGLQGYYMQKQIQEILDFISDYDWQAVELALAILKAEQHAESLPDIEAIAS